MAGRFKSICLKSAAFHVKGYDDSTVSVWSNFRTQPPPSPIQCLMCMYACVCWSVCVCGGVGVGGQWVCVCACMCTCVRMRLCMCMGTYFTSMCVCVCFHAYTRDRQTDWQKELVRLLIAYISHSHSISEYLHKFIIFMKVAMTLKTGQGHQHYTWY